MRKLKDDFALKIKKTEETVKKAQATKKDLYSKTQAVSNLFVVYI